MKRYIIYNDKMVRMEICTSDYTAVSSNMSSTDSVQEVPLGNGIGYVVINSVLVEAYHSLPIEKSNVDMI